MAQESDPMSAAHAVKGTDDAGHDAVHLHREIAQTRASMAHTLDAIQERINPRNVADRAMASVRQQARVHLRDFRETASSTAADLLARTRVPRERLMRGARQNPRAVILGAVAAWVVVRALSSRQPHTTRRPTR